MVPISGSTTVTVWEGSFGSSWDATNRAQAQYLLVGNEAHIGLDELARNSNTTSTVPLASAGVNVAVATTVALGIAEGLNGFALALAGHLVESAGNGVFLSGHKVLVGHGVNELDHVIGDDSLVAVHAVHQSRADGWFVDLHRLVVVVDVLVLGHRLVLAVLV